MNILMTGAGAPGGAGIIRSLTMDPDVLLHVADANSAASGRYLCPNFHLIPAANSTEFIPILLELCVEWKIDLILPLVTRELLPLATHAAKFREYGTFVLVSSASALEVANDKGNLYTHLAMRGITVPAFKIVDTADDLEAAAHELGYPDVPVVVKPRRSNGSRGLRILDPCKDRLSILFDEKPSALFSSLEEILTIVSDRTVPPLVVSEYLPGNELTVDTLTDKGEVIVILVRTRDSINGGISTSGRFIHDCDVERYIREITATLPELYGPIGFQLKRAVDGSFKLLESNPRLQGTSVAGLGCGVNLSLVAVRHALGMELPTYTKKLGVGFVRIYQELFYEY